MGRDDGSARGHRNRWRWAFGSVLLAAIVSVGSWAGQVTYTYDDAGRLTVVQYDDGAQVTYTLDAAGNRTRVVSNAAIPITAPTALKASPASVSSIALSWTAPTGGSGQFTYNLYRGGTQVAQNIASISTTDTGLAAQTAYSYTVAAVDTDGSLSPQSSAASATTYAPPVISSFTVTTVSATQVVVSWSASDSGGPGLSSVSIFRNGASIARLGGTATSYTDAGLSPGAGYSYLIQVTDTAGDATSSSTQSVTTYALPVISAFTATTASQTSINLAWSASDTGGPGGLSYTVERGQTVLSCTASPCTDTGLAIGTQYTYTLIATDSAGDTSSAGAGATTLPGAPGSVSVSSITTTSAQVSWTAAAGVVSYYEYSLNGGFTWGNTGTALSVSLTGLPSGTSYTVLVNAVNAGGMGPNSSAAFETVVGAPTLSETGSGAACPSDIIKWTSVTGATSYQLWSREYTPSLDSSYNEIYTGTALSLRVTLPTHYGYYYQAAACNANGCGAFSNTITVTEETCP